MVEVRGAVPIPSLATDEAAALMVLCETLLRGSAILAHDEMEARLSDHGATLVVQRSARWLTFSGSTPASALGDLMSVVTEMLVRAEHAETEVAQARLRLARQLSLARAQPHVVAEQSLITHCFGPAAAMRDMPSGADLTSVTADQVRALHARCLRPEGAVLVLVGDHDPERTVRFLDSALGEWRGASVPATLPALPSTVPGVRLQHRPDSVQSQIRLLRCTVPRSDAAFPALCLAEAVFGGYFSSRLVTVLREREGLAYRVSSRLRDTADRLSLLVEADSATEATARSYGIILSELHRLSDDPPSMEEIGAACQYTAGVMTMSLSSQSGMASALLTALLLNLPIDHACTFPRRLSDVSQAEVREAVNTFFSPDSFSGIVIGDAQVLSAPLADLGVQFDSNAAM
ncbi:insulinase family protein [Streptomyces sp. MUM 2J]|nr:insulinase family protein [Streptomyces sp. MUM 2J]